MEILLILLLAYLVLCLMATYSVYSKAGVPGWYGFIPVYSAYVMNAITFGKEYSPIWVANIILTVISPIIAGIDSPIAAIVCLVITTISFVYSFCLSFNFAKTFGWSTGGAVCYVLFPWISLFILAFGNSSYEGPVEDTLVQKIGDIFLEN